MMRTRSPLAGMIAVPVLCGWLISGMQGSMLILILVLVIGLTAPRLSTDAAMRLYGAVPLDPMDAPGVYRGLTQLAQRVGLPRLPLLYRIRSVLPSAFAIGGRDHAAIAVSDGLVHLLSGRELNAVLAHEVAHIAANDVLLMRLGDLLQRLTSLVCTVGLVSAFVMVLLDPSNQVSIWAIWVLALAPTGLTLLELALSRGREFAADESAAHLTGDPLALASALHKLEAVNRWSLRRLFGQVTGLDVPSCLRTHPPTSQRLTRLRELARTRSQARQQATRRNQITFRPFLNYGSHN